MDQGSGRVPGTPEAEPADLAEQWRPAADDDPNDEPDDAPAGWVLPAEASEADVAEQFRSAPLDDDDRR